MIKPAFLEPEERSTHLGRVFGTPLVVKGWTGLPLLELVAWGILSWVAGQKHPDWSRPKRAGAGAVTAAILLGSEWCHNLAHTYIASRIGKPADAMRIFWGTPLLIYYDINDRSVAPSQHIARALGGPMFNALLVPLFWIARCFAKKGSFHHYWVNFALGTNCVLSTISLLPIPGIDGGPLLKWSLVNAGYDPSGADQVVKKVNLAVGAGLGLSSAIALKKRRKWLAGALAAFAVTSLAIGTGLLKEQK